MKFNELYLTNVPPPPAQWIVHGKDFASKGKYTPLEGATLTGKILATYHGGRVVYQGL